MSRQKSGQNHVISGLFVYMLLGAFAVLCVMMVLMGAQAYRGIVDRSTEHSDERILRSFLRSAVQTDDYTGVISAEQEQGLDVVKFTYDYDGEIYIKRLYCADGALRELFISADREFDAAAGEVICAAQSMTAQLEDGLLTANLVAPDGEEYAVHIALHARDAQ